ERVERLGGAHLRGVALDLAGRAGHRHLVLAGRQGALDMGSGRDRKGRAVDADGDRNGEAVVEKDSEMGVPPGDLAAYAEGHQREQEEDAAQERSPPRAVKSTEVCHVAPSYADRTRLFWELFLHEPAKDPRARRGLLGEGSLCES